MNEAGSRGYEAKTDVVGFADRLGMGCVGGSSELAPMCPGSHTCIIPALQMQAGLSDSLLETGTWQKR